MIVEVLSIWYGIVCMLSWGCGDFLAKRIVGSVGYYRLLLYTQLVGLAPTLLLLTGFTFQLPSSLRTIALIVGTGVCSFSALFFFYKGLALGNASIISPVASTCAVVAIALSFAILGETLSIPQVLCIAFVLIGIIGLSMRFDSSGRSNLGISYALGSTFFAGLNAILIKLISVDIGQIGTLFFNRIVLTLILLIILPFFENQSPTNIHRTVPLNVIIAVGLAEFVGYLAFIVGLDIGFVSIVTPISSASPTVTVVLAQGFLKETLTQTQKISVVLVILGIILLSLMSSI
jgi:uncharacterized membrane protein